MPKPWHEHSGQVKKFRVQFVVEDYVADWLRRTGHISATVAEAVTVCAKLRLLAEKIDALLKQTQEGAMPLNVEPSENVLDEETKERAARLMRNVIAMFDEEVG